MDEHMKDTCKKHFPTLGFRVGTSKEDMIFKLRRKGQERGRLMKGEECYRKSTCKEPRSTGKRREWRVFSELGESHMILLHLRRLCSLKYLKV